MSVQHHQNAGTSEYRVLKVLKQVLKQAPNQKKANYQPRVVVLVFVTSLIATACQPASPPASQASSTPPSSSSSASPTSTPASATSNQYVDQTLGIRFDYPNDFVIDDLQPNTTPGEVDVIETIDLWHQEKFEAIVAGEYEGGTELPPNVQITVSPNPDRLSLTDWVASQEQQFVQPRDLQPQTISGQEALGFASTGLYEHKNVVFASQSGNEVILISLATVGVPGVDEPNQRAFRQVISTFELK